MKEKAAPLALVNINELVENLVTEVRHSWDFSAILPLCGPAPLLWISIPSCVSYCEFPFSSFVCADRRLTLVYYQKSLGILIYWISARKKANHSKIINLTYSFRSFTTKWTMFISDHVYIVVINKVKSSFC
jgi:hypothetical protein